MRYREITEAPITDMSFHGDLETAGSFRASDLKMMRSQVWNGRVVKAFEKCPYDIGLYFVNGPEMGKIDFSTPLFKSTVRTTRAYEYVGLHAPGWARIVLGGKLPEGWENRVNVILTQNEGADRVGLTPWMVAHRMGHCFLESNGRPENRVFAAYEGAASNILVSLVANMEAHLLKAGMIPSNYESDDSRVNKVAPFLSPFRAARDGNLRNVGEYLVELMAQFLTSGRVTFKRIEIDGPARMRRMEPQEKALFAAMKSAIYGYQYHPMRESSLEKELPVMFDAMKKLPGGPKNRKQTLAMYERWVGEGFFGAAPSGTDAMWEKIEQAEETINAAFSHMLDIAKGQFVVL